MSKLNYGPITLTGNVFVNDWLASVRSAQRLPKTPERGDLKIYSRPARNAPRSATSWGADYYPGVLQVSVFDGKGWRNLTVRLHLPELERAHGSEEEMLRLLDAMSARLARHKKEQVLWARKATKTYYLPKARPEAAPQATLASPPATPVKATPEPAQGTLF